MVLSIVLKGKREEFLEQLLSSRNRSRSRSGKKRYSYAECSSSSSDVKEDVAKNSNDLFKQFDGNLCRKLMA